MVLAAGLLSNSVTELHEATILNSIGSRPWDTESFISMTSDMGKFLHTLFGYDAAPSMLQIGLYWTYLLAVLGAYVAWPSVRLPERQEPAAATVTSES